MEVIFDTNFFLIPGEFGVDVFEELEKTATFKYEIYVIDKTVDELHKIIKEQKGKHSANAKLGLQLLEKKKIKIIKTETLKNVDELIKEHAKKAHTLVATQDKALQNALRQKGVGIISLRQKKRLMINQEAKNVP